LLLLDRVDKTYWRGAHQLIVLDGVSLQIERGELVAVQGARRTGKTTLLSVAAGLLAPDAGSVRFEGGDLPAPSGCGDALLADGLGWARCGEGAPAGVPALHHVTTPLLPLLRRRAAERRAAEALALVGAERCARATWDRLSDLERTLVVLARALARRPKLLLVDDPTVGLRATESEHVVRLLRSQAEADGLGVLITVPERTAARGAHRVLTLRDGGIVAPLPPSDDGGRVIPLPVRR
jgi:putative ABC transport system ATP-binding protein